MTDLAIKVRELAESLLRVTRTAEELMDGGVFDGILHEAGYEPDSVANLLNAKRYAQEIIDTINVAQGTKPVAYIKLTASWNPEICKVYSLDTSRFYEVAQELDNALEIQGDGWGYKAISHQEAMELGIIGEYVNPYIEA